MRLNAGPLNPERAQNESLLALLSTERIDNRFTDPEGDLPITLAVWNRTPELQELEVTYSVTDDDGNRVAAGQESYLVDSQGVTPFNFTVRPGKPGIFHVVFQLQGEHMELTRTLDFEVQEGG